METNEISMFMDAKLDIHNKRPESLKFKTWSRCLVKIEAVKCLPSFLRIQITRSHLCDKEHSENSELHCPAMGTVDKTEQEFNVSIKLPGVNISETESRTKPHSYGLFWRQHRRDCFIYFAIETESSYRRHMKWIKKSIKNLELHRQLSLELRRNTYGSKSFGEKSTRRTNHGNENIESGAKISITAKNTLGPLPKIPEDNISGTWSSSGPRVSEIYEEILEHDSEQTPRMSRRLSRTSIASGIYEEMKPTPASNFNAIFEEVLRDPKPPPVPPLPQRKRINTFQTESGMMGEVRRSSTNPESAMAKKKKYKNMLKNSIFGVVGRTKRATSVSESVVCSVNELLIDRPNVYKNAEEPVFGEYPGQRTLKTKGDAQLKTQSERKSYSIPDLATTNRKDSLDEVVEVEQNSFTHREDLIEGLNEVSVQRIIGADDASSDTAILSPKEGSPTSLNISERIPVNFNFSACNESTINLVGASGATQVQSATTQKNIIAEDLTGYCVMAPIPIKSKQENSHAKTNAQTTQPAFTISSGYSSAGSHSSSSSTVSLSKIEHRISTKASIMDDDKKLVAEESGIYEEMILKNNSLNSYTAVAVLYENMLTIEATQELAAVELQHATTSPKISTSTPTGDRDAEAVSEENFYQTPRRSIVSVDDKVPSYYPNSSESNKTRRSGDSPSKFSSSPIKDLKAIVAASNVTNRQDASPTKKTGLNQREVNQNQASKFNKSKKSAAHKIREHVYNVSHVCNKKGHKITNNEIVNTIDVDEHSKLQRELLHLAALQSIDFKFDEPAFNHNIPIIETPAASEQLSKEKCDESEAEPGAKVDDENCFETKENKKSTTMLQKIVTAARKSPMVKSPVAGSSTARTVELVSHHLQQNQHENVQQLAPSGAETPAPAAEICAKKFASLPRFKKIDFSPLKLRISNVLQRGYYHHQQQQEQTVQQHQLS